MTHVPIPPEFTTPLSTLPLNGDSIGYVSSFDFSTANLSHEHRIAAISTIASICYANPNALGSIKLYDRLSAESHGLPSSSFEFVPVLLPARYILDGDNVNPFVSACIKYGEWVEDHRYLLTNLRALIADIGPDKAATYFNTPEECSIIARHFKVFRCKIDLSTRSQLVRHRASFQELSRRYVSGKREPFEFYISPKLRYIPRSLPSVHYTEEGCNFTFVASTLADTCVSLYEQAITAGVKPEEARRILPQSMYTTLWSAWLPSQFENLISLRCTPHAQSEIRELVTSMSTL